MENKVIETITHIKSVSNQKPSIELIKTKNKKIKEIVVENL